MTLKKKTYKKANKKNLTKQSRGASVWPDLKICSIHFKMVSQIREEYLVRSEDEVYVGPTLSTQLKEHIKTRKHECFIKRCFTCIFDTDHLSRQIRVTLGWKISRTGVWHILRKRIIIYLMFLMLIFSK